MSTTTANISAADWLDVRDSVASKVKGKRNIQLPTQVAIAEDLLREGYIDLEAVLKVIRPQTKSPSQGATSIKHLTEPDVSSIALQRDGK